MKCSPSVSLHLCSLEVVLVNHYANSATAFVFKAANHTSVAVDLHITTRTHYISGKQDREVHDRAHGNVAIDREEHTVGGDILRLRRTRSALRLQLHRQMQGKPRSTLHFGIVLDRSLRLRVARLL